MLDLFGDGAAMMLAKIAFEWTDGGRAAEVVDACSRRPAPSPPLAWVPAVARSRSRIGHVVMENDGQQPATIRASPPFKRGHRRVRGHAR